MQDEAGRFVGKKLYEISYALCRVAARINPGIGARIEESAFRIVEMSDSLNIRDIRHILEIAKNQIKLGADSGIINKGNGEVVIGEIVKLEAFLRTVREVEIGNGADLEGIFSSQYSPERKKTKVAESFPAERLEFGNLIAEKNSNEGSEDNKSAEIRQKLIADFVEQSGNCRMRDLIERFPNTSERTLRNDLQSLSAKNLIERLGEGGPGTYYRHKMPLPPSSVGGTGPISGEGLSNL